MQSGNVAQNAVQTISAGSGKSPQAAAGETFAGLPGDSPLLTSFAALLKKLSAGEGMSAEEWTGSLPLLADMFPVPDLAVVLPKEDSEQTDAALELFLHFLNDSAAFERLLNDPKLQLWLQEAAALLQPVVANGNDPAPQGNQGGLPSAVSDFLRSAGLTGEPALQRPNQQETAVWMQSGMVTGETKIRPADRNLNGFAAAAASGQPAENTAAGPQILVPSAKAREIFALFAKALEERPDDPAVQALAQNLRHILSSHHANSAALPVQEEAFVPAFAEQSRAVKHELGGWMADKTTVTVSADADRSVDPQIRSAVKHAHVSTAQQHPAPLLQMLAAKSSGFLADEPAVLEPQQSATVHTEPKQWSHLVSAPVQPKEVFAGEHLVRHTAPVLHQTVNAQQFSEEMSQFIFKSLKFNLTNQVSEAKITLQPQHLGQVDVKITLENGLLTAQFTAQTLHGKELLENQLPQLRAALQTQGLQVDKLVVSQNSGVQSGFFHDHRQQQSQQQYPQQRHNDRSYETYLTLEPDLNQGWGEVREIQGSGIYGNSFDATA